MKRVIAIDPGSSFIKILTESRRGKYHAVARVIDDDCADGETLKLDGKRYLVGAQALRSRVDELGEVRPNLQAGFHGSDAQRAQICYALQRMDAAGDYDTLVLSLPYTDSMHSALCDKLRARRDYVWHDGGGTRHSVHFDQVEIMAQGVGSLVVMQSLGRQPQTLQMSDIGSCTLDETALRWDNDTRRYRFLRERSRSRRTVSAHAFFVHWYNLLREMDGMQDLKLGYYELMDLAAGEVFAMRYGQRTVDIRPSFEAARRWFTDAVHKTLCDDMGAKLLAEVEVIVLTGGGAKLVDVARLQRTDERFVTMDIWANVEGQWMQATGEAKDQRLHDRVANIREVQFA